MTKTLTEQWREGTLRGCFYWKLPNGNICTAYTDIMRDIKNVRDSNEIEVLQETPSYVEYNQLVSKTEQLEKKLEIAIKALEELETKSDKFDNSWSMQEQLDFIKAKCQETLYQIKEMEGVK